MIDMRRIAASSGFAGFQNYTIITPTINLPAVVIPAGGETGQIISTFNLNNSNAVSRIRINYQTEGANWYQVEGPLSTFSHGITTGYDIFTIINYTSSGVLSVVINEINLTVGSSVSVPAQVINLSARLFLTPF